jgi:hypothetical protein
MWNTPSLMFANPKLAQQVKGWGRLRNACGCEFVWALWAGCHIHCPDTAEEFICWFASRPSAIPGSVRAVKLQRAV